MHRSTTYHSTSYFDKDLSLIDQNSSLRDRYEILNQWRDLTKPAETYYSTRSVPEEQQVLLDLREFIESKGPAKFIECMKSIDSLGAASLFCYDSK